MGTTAAILDDVKESAQEPATLLHDFIAQQHANVFSRAFAVSTSQLPTAADHQADLADRILLTDSIGFIFQLAEREQNVVTKAGEIEKWAATQVVRKGVKLIQNTREVLASYTALSLVNHFGHRLTVAPKDPESLIGIVVYRVPPKSRPFRVARFKRVRDGTFVHIIRDTDYFEICDHFVTPAELVDYFNFRRDMLLGWDPPTTAVSEMALIGQYLLEDFESPPDQRLERAARARRSPAACEFSFVLDSLAAKIAAQEDHDADSDYYHILSELAQLGRFELRALSEQMRLALESVRGDRFELPYRMASSKTGCGFLILPLTREFHDRGYDALESLARASKHELDLGRQVGIGMWKNTEFVDIDWLFLAGENQPDPSIDERLAYSYPFRNASDRRLPPIFT
ncbi:MAG TPA: hypothetical protein VJ840_04890 [Gemmatimonadaceae bacterium]|nr:hypothetical protein [Gemmatimonadaceae bacterium]